MTADYCFLVFLITIVTIRIALYLTPVAAPTIGGFRTHHYMYGVLGISAALMTRSLILFAISAGAFVDEATFVIMRGKTHEDNYSVLSLCGTALFVILVFTFRSWLVLPFLS